MHPPRLRLLFATLAAASMAVPAVGHGTGRGGTPPTTSPVDPPRVHYVIDCDLDPAGSLKGTETAQFTNRGRQPIERLALAWSAQRDPSFALTLNGRLAAAVETPSADGSSPLLLVDLPRAVPPGGTATIKTTFSTAFRLDKRGRVNLLAWHPRIWWGRDTHDDFDVKVQPPPGFAFAATAPLVPSTGRYSARGVRSFAMVLAQGHEVLETRSGDVAIRAIHTKGGAECARLLAETAADAVTFYRERFGFYPQRALTIVPGSEEPVGGYPVATGVVVVHGQEKFAARPASFWRWITAHEIGHQYWLEHVLSAEPEDWGWLMIGLGIYADREYSRARGITDQHQKFFARYVDGVRKGIDTTIDLTPDQRAEVNWDFNNIATHGKGFSVISALEVTVGHDAFERAYRRSLREYAGRPLGLPQFQAICENESGQSLDWFFRQWVRSPRYLSYTIAGQSSEKIGNETVTSVTVKRLGSLSMPIPVVARFADGSTKTQFTDRLRATEVVAFRGPGAAVEVSLDPAGELAMVVPPPDPTAGEVSQRIGRLSWAGSGDQGLDVYRDAVKAKITKGNDWFKLGLVLYDGRHYEEALAAMQEAARFNAGIWEQSAIVWQGHLHDLLGKRDDALRCYRQALDKGFTGPMRHDQWNMVLDRKWVEERLTTPFTRK